MRFWQIFILLGCLFFSGSFTSFARSAKSRERVIDPSYSSALAAANRFLHAWQTQDHETAIMMLTDAARQKASPGNLQGFFSPGEHAAYEIQRGKRLSGGEYVFPIVLFGALPNSQPHACRLMMMRTGKDEWAVNRVP